MLVEFESFYYKRNVHKGSWNQKPIFHPAPHLIWFIDFQVPGKGFLVVFKKITQEALNSLFPYYFFEKWRNLCQAKSMLLSFWNTSWLDIRTFWLLVTFYSMQRRKTMCKKFDTSLIVQSEHNITQGVHLVSLLGYSKSLFLKNLQCCHKVCI